MTDIERQVTDFFHEEAGRATPSPGMYGRVLRRSQARRVMTSVVIGVAAIAVVVAGVVTAGALRGSTKSGVSAPNNRTQQGPVSRGAIARIPAGHAPQPIAADDAGAWVVSGVGETTSVLWHIDARTERATKLPQTRGANWPAVGEGFAWVSCQGAANPCGGSSILKLDPHTGATLATIPIPGFTSEPIATGLGSVWVSTTSGSLVKIDPRSAKIVATFPLSVPTDHLAIAGSSLWATSANVVMQIDPSNGHILSRLTFRDPCELLATDQGIWVSSCQGPDLPDKLMRIDPASGRVVYRVPLGDSGPMVFTDGQLWLALWARDHFELQARAPDTGKPTGSALNVTPGPHPWGAIGMLGPPRAFMAIGAGSFWLTHVDEADVVRVRLGGSGAK